MWKEELKHEFQGWSARVNTSLEKFEGELTQVAGKIRTVQSWVEELCRDRQTEESRMSDLEKRMGTIENRSATLVSHVTVRGKETGGEPSLVGRQRGGKYPGSS